MPAPDGHEHATIADVCDYVTSVIASTSSRTLSLAGSSHWESLSVRLERTSDVRTASGDPMAAEVDVVVTSIHRGEFSDGPWDRTDAERARVSVALSRTLAAPAPPWPASPDIEALAVCVRGRIVWNTAHRPWQRTPLVRELHPCPPDLASLLSQHPVLRVAMTYVGAGEPGER